MPNCAGGCNVGKATAVPAGGAPSPSFPEGDVAQQHDTPSSKGTHAALRQLKGSLHDERTPWCQCEWGRCIPTIETDQGQPHTCVSKTHGDQPHCEHCLHRKTSKPGQCPPGNVAAIAGRGSRDSNSKLVWQQVGPQEGVAHFACTRLRQCTTAARRLHQFCSTFPEPCRAPRLCRGAERWGPDHRLRVGPSPSRPGLHTALVKEVWAHLSGHWCSMAWKGADCTHHLIAATVIGWRRGSPD